MGDLVERGLGPDPAGHVGHHECFSFYSKVIGSLSGVLIGVTSDLLCQRNTPVAMREQENGDCLRNRHSYPGQTAFCKNEQLKMFLINRKMISVGR